MIDSSSRWPPAVFRLLAIIAFICLSGSYAFAQAAGSDYTKDLPSVERVKAELKGSSEDDTLARQAAIFEYLMDYIQRIKENRDYSGSYTPGEIQARTAYSLAGYQIEQAYKKSHTAAEFETWSHLEGRYEVNNALNWIHQLSGAQANAAYSSAEAGLNQTYKKHEAQLQQQMRQGWGGGGDERGPNGMRNDAGSVAVRRCLELGGTALQCLGKGMSTGFLDFLGMSQSPLMEGPSHSGLALNGQFRSGNGLSAQFTDTSVSLSNCGKLLIDARSYAIQRNGSQLLIHVKNSPSPFTFVLGLDGNLQGPSSAEMAGKVITGYSHVWVANMATPGYYESQTTTSNQELTPLEAGQYAGQSGLTQNGQTYNMATTSTQSTYVPGSGGGGHYENVPIYAAKTQACSIGRLMPGPATAVDPGMLTGIANLAGALFGDSANNPRSGAQDMLAPGIRIAGIYTSPGGLKAAFVDASVVLDCGQAHVREKYTVERQGSRIFVRVQNSASPLTLEVQPDGSFSGPASVTVNGRLVSGMNGEDVTFTPHSETCNLGTFRPEGSASAPTTLAAGPAAAPPPASPVEASPAAPAAHAYSSSPSSAAPVRAQLRVLIHAQFAGADPLAGQPVYVVRERMDDALRKLGFPVPAGTSPGKAMAELAAACEGKDCKPVYAALGKYFVASTRLDTTGKATLSAQAMTGRYYFYATARTGNRALVWDVPADLAAGDNTVTLTAANAETLGQ